MLQCAFTASFSNFGDSNRQQYNGSATALTPVNGDAAAALVSREHQHRAGVAVLRKAGRAGQAWMCRHCSLNEHGTFPSTP